MLRSVLLSLRLRAAAGCSSDEDCQLSGICSGGVCQCDAIWKGDDCSELNFLAPDDVQPAYPPPDLVNDTTSWGASVPSAPKHKLFCPRRLRSTVFEASDKGKRTYLGRLGVAAGRRRMCCWAEEEVLLGGGGG